MSPAPQIIDDLDIGIIVHDPETAEIVYANNYAGDLYGYTSQELQTMDVSEFSAPSHTQAEAERYVRAAAQGNPQRFEWRIQRSNDELLWITVKLRKTALDGTPYVVAQVRDITEYKIRERRLRLLNRITRHNLRNKVNVIHGYTEELRTTIREKSSRDQLESIHGAANDLLELTDTVAALKSITDRETLVREPINVGSLVTEVVETYRTEYPEVDWAVTCESEIWVSADEGFRMAFEEVLENAVEHNSRDDLQVQVTVTESDENAFALVRTTDNGSPIPEIELEEIDEEYELNPLSHGGGAGFWVMESVIESLGGRLTVKARGDRGNTVEFKLPQTTSPSTGDTKSCSV